MNLVDKVVFKETIVREARRLHRGHRARIYTTIAQVAQVAQPFEQSAQPELRCSVAQVAQLH